MLIGVPNYLSAPIALDRQYAELAEFFSQALATDRVSTRVITVIGRKLSGRSHFLSHFIRTAPSAQSVDWSWLIDFEAKVEVGSMLRAPHQAIPSRSIERTADEALTAACSATGPHAIVIGDTVNVASLRRMAGENPQLIIIRVLESAAGAMDDHQAVVIPREMTPESLTEITGELSNSTIAALGNVPAYLRLFAVTAQIPPDLETVKSAFDRVCSYEPGSEPQLEVLTRLVISGIAQDAIPLLRRTLAALSLFDGAAVDVADISGIADDGNGISDSEMLATCWEIVRFGLGRFEGDRSVRLFKHVTHAVGNEAQLRYERKACLSTLIKVSARMCDAPLSSVGIRECTIGQALAAQAETAAAESDILDILLVFADRLAAGREFHHADFLLGHIFLAALRTDQTLLRAWAAGCRRIAVAIDSGSQQVAIEHILLLRSLLTKYMRKTVEEKPLYEINGVLAESESDAAAAMGIEPGKWREVQQAMERVRSNMTFSIIHYLERVNYYLATCLRLSGDLAAATDKINRLATPIAPTIDPLLPEQIVQERALIALENHHPLLALNILFRAPKLDLRDPRLSSVVSRRQLLMGITQIAFGNIELGTQIARDELAAATKLGNVVGVVEARLCLVRGLIANRGITEARDQLQQLLTECEWHYGKVCRRYIDALWLTVEVAELDNDLNETVKAALNWCAVASAVLFDSHPLLVRARRMLWELLTASR